MAEKDKKAETTVEGLNTPMPVKATGNVPETVTIPRKEWEDAKAALSKIPDMVSGMEILRAAADKNRIAQIEDKLKTPGNSIVKLRTFRKEGVLTLVVGWKMTKNDSYIDPLTKREVADQKIEITLEDGSKYELPYNDFSRFTEEKVLAEVIGRAGEMYTVRLLSEDRQLVLDAKFLN